ncbi:DNA replication licensing factor MCM6 [Nematocida major]|uniref:DNA replication licensing factor MCM6 n=1 Tax=Nematocida major TaxID=1912982 RepID=UPI0020078DF0|nr:DNA replication licensing factor MCM6 [Nematocida major]KAH9386068.1 DNA replication licensing factor MCM6 [Nematocida major]
MEASCIQKCIGFLEAEDRNRNRKYVQEIKKAIEENRRSIPIEYSDIFSYDQELAIEVKKSFPSVEKDLAKAIEMVTTKYCPEFKKKGINTRQEDFIPCIYGLDVLYSVRDLKTSLIGQLISFSGIVTRSSQSKPELIEGSFECAECKAIIRGIHQERTFRQPLACINPICMNRTKFKLSVDESVFSDYQKIRVQEPVGDTGDAHAIPRTIEVLLRNDLVEIAKPGDCAVITGYLMAVSCTRDVLGHSNTTKVGLTKAPEAEAVRGRSAQGKSINHELVFAGISVAKKQYDPYTSLLESNPGTESVTALNKMKVDAMRQAPNLLSKLANSLFPSVCGHENIKTAILLMLVGGTSKKTPEGIPLRGDINILLVGDPGTSKSQFLKQTSTLVERGVYTSGKGSSAAGLTASVIRDETGEFSIEAGALMLSDSGVCCIDEFDKMDERDRVAIHEAMEQQSITIAKGGIHATLSARTSILAAANPVRGRYDLRKTLRQNVRLSPPIMSRFDLFFILVDSISAEHDQIISSHILKNHMAHNGVAVHQETAFTVEDVKVFIQTVKTRTPAISKKAGEAIVEKYMEIRKNTGVHSFTATPRQLESIIRLSEAVAKIFGLEEVTTECVEQAYMLLSGSIMNVLTDDVKLSVADVVGEKVLTISYDEYIKITSSLVKIVQSYAGHRSVGKEDLIKEYIEENENELTTEEEYVCMQEKISGLIDQLIYKEGIFYQQSEDAGILLHPNYNTF